MHGSTTRNSFPSPRGLGSATSRPIPTAIKSPARSPPSTFINWRCRAVRPRPGIDFDPEAAERGDALFSGKADCNRCHRKPLWTEPGWNQHTPMELKIDDFQANRAPGLAYRTMNLAGIFVRERGLFMDANNQGRFYHDGRFQTLLDVVASYNDRFNLGLTDEERRDLVEYLKSL